MNQLKKKTIKNKSLKRYFFLMIILIIIIFIVFTTQESFSIKINPEKNETLVKNIIAKQPTIDTLHSLKEYYSVTGPNTQTDKGSYYNPYYAPQALVINCYAIIGDPVVTFESIHKAFIANSWQWISQDPQNPNNPQNSNMQNIINKIRSGEALFATEYYLRPANESKYTEYREDLSFFTLRNIPDPQLRYDVCETKGLSQHIPANTHILETYTTVTN